MTAPDRIGAPRPAATTPSLIEAFQQAEQRLAEQLGRRSPIDTEEAARRLAILLAAHALAEELDDRHRRNQLERDRLQSEQRQVWALGWLHVGRWAWRTLLTGGAVLIVATLWLTGEIEPGQLMRFLP